MLGMIAEILGRGARGAAANLEREFQFQK
jgi:hypothetical protein